LLIAGVFMSKQSALSAEASGKKVLILGLARQGLALARFFTASGAHVTLSDMAAPQRLEAESAAASALGATLALGGHPLELLDECDLLCLSGGVPPQIDIVRTAVERGIPLSNDSLLTLQLARERGLGPIIAITGSSGKTTTTTLVGEMLRNAGLTAHVGGNIGTPLIDRLADIQPGEPIVLELSSFQLEIFDAELAFGSLEGAGPDVAALLNITPNHLDRHPSMAAYAAAKFNLLRCLPAGATLVLSADDAVTGTLASYVFPELDAPPPPAEWEMAPLLDNLAPILTAPGLTVDPFSRTRILAQGAWMEGDALVYNRKVFCRRDEVRLRGEHNLSNLLGAAAISGAAGATLESLTQVARSFEGVRHRLEVVLEHNGVTWVNDSIATSPERALAGLRSFNPAQQSIILLAGGKDKNLPWEELADEVLERVSFLIGFGQAGAMIIDKVRERDEQRRMAAQGPSARHGGEASGDQRTPGMAVVLRLEEAVELAARSAQPGTVVLLSPGGTSYDAYRDFEARGLHFRELVEALASLSDESRPTGAPTRPPQTAAEGAD
jgi:UDP-N-acetylmuramoylalanine--D-glutamate ligase